MAPEDGESNGGGWSGGSLTAGWSGRGVVVDRGPAAVVLVVLASAASDAAAGAAATGAVDDDDEFAGNGDVVEGGRFLKVVPPAWMADSNAECSTGLAACAGEIGGAAAGTADRDGASGVMVDLDLRSCCRPTMNHDLRDDGVSGAAGVLGDAIGSGATL